MKSKVLIGIGTVMILMALFLTGFNIYQDKRAEKLAASINEEIKEVLQNNEQKWKDAYENLPNMEMPVVQKDGHYYIGSLDIPKLSLSLPVMSESNQNNLQIAPCRFYGSVYTDDMVIAGHNYQSHFLYLSDLQAHDKVIFQDMDGNVFNYEVVGIEGLKETQYKEMVESEFDLTLYTCTYSGLERITVRCVRTK